MSAFEIVLRGPCWEGRGPEASSEVEKTFVRSVDMRLAQKLIRIAAEVVWRK